ncbi:MAG TPA: MtrAB system histidine kinase MtrB [Actinomycetes bacterium]|nr:MtrAB system histidine kinase MtrB [Actinomycetes bacterium]
MPLFGLDSAARAVRLRWRSSLYLRVVVTTLTLSIIVVAVLGQILVSRIADGLIEAKQRTSLVEARAGLNQAEALIAASDRTGPANTPELADQIANQLANRVTGIPRIYDVLLLSQFVEFPQLGSSFVNEDSIPPALRETVRLGGVQASTFTEISYIDGRPPVPGFAVGAPLVVPGFGAAELYYVFPLTQEQQTLDLVRRTLLFAGLVLVALLAWISWFVTRQVVDPVRYAASIAEQFSAGRLTERMKVEGNDELARLARSFNDMAASLQRQIGQLEDLSRVQRRFVSDVSHELRTPLTTVRMAADVLHESRDGFDAATARSAELLQTQLDRFEALLADLLEISRFDAGAAMLDTAPIDVREMVSQAIDAYATLAERMNTEVTAVLPPHPVVAEFDARRVDRILRNLLVNAIEHGEGRPIVISIGESEDAVAVSVRDHGTGLRPGETSLVFNRFWRADPARARTTGGTGLGLPISLEDARLHGGWLQAWGEPGDGTNFRLTLPRHAGSDIQRSPLPLEPPDARRGRRMPMPVGAGSHPAAHRMELPDE